MLKIKDNVELKELEQFGFVKDGDNYIFESGIHKYTDGEDNKVGGFSIYVNTYKSIFIRTEDLVEDGWVSNFGKLVELVQAGLVEDV